MLVRDKKNKSRLYSEDKKYMYELTGDERDIDYIRTYDVLIKLGVENRKDFIDFFNSVKIEIQNSNGMLPVNVKDSVSVKNVLKGCIK